MKYDVHLTETFLRTLKILKKKYRRIKRDCERLLFKFFFTDQRRRT
ncbi:Uncharacterized protein dnm_020470 [Desulfonema magnum]|uniref:Uncharacterized protein n=1 Tax=Desulfonema magnum TaxID=45655 RepID=A0A975BHW4_9BACT|nr:Uncharacterized protein dnm_020470 [Desulfonema magnum]